MSEIRIASRYAKSLIELAGEQGVSEAVNADMRDFVLTCNHSKELAIMLKSPVIHGDKKIQVLKAAFTGFNALTHLFLSTVVRKGREAYLPLIAKEAVEIYNTQHNIASAKVITAVAVDSALLDDIKKVLEGKTGKKILLETEVDSSLIGGLVVRMGDSLYDASIANKLKKIKKQLVLN
jgi:F-type H+-transporting ATPase subunit delta